VVPRESDGVLDLAFDEEVPRREVRGRDRARVQHRPLVGEVLAGREPRGVVARLDHLSLGATPEHGPTVIGMAVIATRVARRPRDFVAVRGPDAATYLQAMVSNDVEALG